MRYKESQFQTSLVTYHYWAVPIAVAVLFSVPNAGKRTPQALKRLIAEGLLAGVSDLILVTASAVVFIELKLKTTKQQDSQEDFQRRVESLGYRYVVIRTLDEYYDLLVSLQVPVRFRPVVDPVQWQLPASRPARKPQRRPPRRSQTSAPKSPGGNRTRKPRTSRKLR